MKTLLLIPIIMMSFVVILYHNHQSNALYEGPSCNENSLLGFPLVSPYFGKKVAFASNVGSADPSNFTLYTVNSDGSGSLNKIGTIPYPSTVAISSDGTTIAFIKQVNKRDQIFIANTDGAVLKQLAFDNETKSVIGITPDGRKVIYGIHYDGLGWIKNYYAIGSDGKNLIQITNDTMKKAWSALSYDGSTLVFNDDSRPSRIFAVRTDGSNFHYVTNGSLFSHTPVISGNGSKLVFSRDNPADTNSKYLFTINTDGTDLVQLTQKPIYSQSDFTISLNGAKVAFDDGSDVSYNVSVINSDGAGYIKMNNIDRYYSHTPLLSSDGSKLIYSQANPKQALFISDAGTYDSSLEVDSATVGYEKEISPDTAEVVYPKIVNSTEEILAATLDGKIFSLFDGSILKPNPDCKILDGGSMEQSSSGVIPTLWYDRVNGWIWVSIGIVAVISFWMFYFRRFKE